MRFSIFALPVLLSLSQLAYSHADHSHSYEWPNGKKAAVVLSYDDAADSQLDIALPQLETFGFKGTFFVDGARTNFASRLDDWRGVANSGHELGNHTLYHPCQKSKPNRDWVAAHRDLDNYSVPQMLDEIAVANTLLNAIDGKTQRTFAYPCEETKAGGESYVEGMKPLITAARHGSKNGLNNPEHFDRYNIAALAAHELSGKELISAVEKSLAENSFIVLTFHGVGGDYLAVEAEAHRQLLAYLQANDALYWVDTLSTVLESLEP